MNKDMRRVREINIQAEAFYNDAVELGDHAAKAFHDLNSSKRNSHRSQMTELENIAEGALKTSDIFDYIKKQIARFDYWRKDVQGKINVQEGFGELLKKYLEEKIAERRGVVCKKIGVAKETDEDKYMRQQVYLQLIRQFIRQMVVQYEYRVSQEEEVSNGANAGRNS